MSSNWDEMLDGLSRLCQTTQIDLQTIGCFTYALMELRETSALDLDELRKRWNIDSVKYKQINQQLHRAGFPSLGRLPESFACARVNNNTYLNTPKGNQVSGENTKSREDNSKSRAPDSRLEEGEAWRKYHTLETRCYRHLMSVREDGKVRQAWIEEARVLTASLPYDRWGPLGFYAKFEDLWFEKKNRAYCWTNNELSREVYNLVDDLIGKHSPDQVGPGMECYFRDMPFITSWRFKSFVNAGFFANYVLSAMEEIELKKQQKRVKSFSASTREHEKSLGGWARYKGG